eukprot:TRINITY_DN518_c0_g1_i5.p3 TRINITY_DN518_c0_g1~~TRINITY_DN518_c0_g1_i5.p3  ORF type:complete len:124 (+),score=18.79 TRINITY_DN518_c0_g1_i5:2289-2660(+)
MCTILAVVTLMDAIQYGAANLISSVFILRQMVDMPARLAWSVHAATDDVRKQLVPTTAHTMEELRDAFAGAGPTTGMDAFTAARISLRQLSGQRLSNFEVCVFACTILALGSSKIKCAASGIG